MRILHIMNWFMENMGYQENYLPFYQAGLGYEVRLLCSKHYPKKRKITGSSTKNITYNDRALQIKRLKSIYIWFIAEQNWYFNLKKEIEDFKPDVIHLHNIWSLPTIQLLMTDFSGKDRVKIFVDSHIDNGNFDFRKLHKYIYYFGFIKKIIVPAMLKRNFIFLAVNSYARDCLARYFTIPSDKIKPLSLGIDSEKVYFSQEARLKMRKNYGIGEKSIIFAFSGVFEKNKSLETLLASFKALAGKQANVFLLLIGKGNLSKDAHYKILERQGRIICPGWQPHDELYLWYSMADIGILPGKLGGIRDILAAGRPLIVNSDLAVSYLVEYNNGLTFQRDNAEELAEIMEAYIKNQNLVREHGERSLQLVREKLSWQNIALKSSQVYSG